MRMSDEAKPDDPLADYAQLIAVIEQRTRDGNFIGIRVRDGVIELGPDVVAIPHLGTANG